MSHEGKLPGSSKKRETSGGWSPEAWEESERQSLKRLNDKLKERRLRREAEAQRQKPNKPAA